MTRRLRGRRGPRLAKPERLQAVFETLFRNAVVHGPARERTESESDSSLEAYELVSHSRSVPVSNASSSGELRITVEVTRDENGTPTGFAVDDDGVGVADDKRESIFETGVTTSRKETGFGLSVVESIVRARDWTIELTGGDRGGARFKISGVDGHRSTPVSILWLTLTFDG